MLNERISKLIALMPACGTALVPLKRKDLDLVFSLQHERVVAKDNTVSFANRSWQLERSKLRGTLAGCRVLLHEHLNGTLTITFGPHVVGRYNEEAVEMTPPRKATKALCRLAILKVSSNCGFARQVISI